jgi:rRNA-processing protein FCF1
MGTRGFLLVDANVLVDYQSADLTILSLVSRHVGPVHIVSTVLAEVDGLDESECERLGFRVVEPTIGQANAAALPDGRLSLADRFCFVVCRDNDWTCVSNDKALHRACESAGVTVLWSLELLLELVKLGHLPADDASQAAERMHRANPVFLGATILVAFREKLAKLEA